MIEKTFTPLGEIPHSGVGKCIGVLPNHMQCWRAGDYLVTVVESIPAKEKGKEPTQKMSFYQLCKHHAAAEKQQYDAEVAQKKSA